MACSCKCCQMNVILVGFVSGKKWFLNGHQYIRKSFNKKFHINKIHEFTFYIIEKGIINSYALKNRDVSASSQ